jgi:hypothetical protein
MTTIQLAEGSGLATSLSRGLAGVCLNITAPSGSPANWPGRGEEGQQIFGGVRLPAVGLRVEVSAKTWIGFGTAGGTVGIMSVKSIATVAG